MQATRTLVHDRRYQNSEKKIYQAIEEFLAESPSTKMTVSNICRLAKIKRSTFYRHFDNIEDAARACLLSIVNEFRETSARILDNASFELLFYLIFMHFSKHHRLYVRLLGNWDFSYFHQIALVLEQVITKHWLKIQPKLTKRAQEQLFDIFTFRLIQELKIWYSIDGMNEDKIIVHTRRLTNLIERLPRRQFDASFSVVF